MFVDGGLTVDETEERMAFAWKHANWRFRSSGDGDFELRRRRTSEDATDAFAKRLFDRCVEALSDREADVRERAFGDLEGAWKVSGCGANGVGGDEREHAAATRQGD